MSENILMLISVALVFRVVFIFDKSAFFPRLVISGISF